MSRMLVAGMLTLTAVVGTLLFTGVRVQALNPSCSSSCSTGLTCAGPTNVVTGDIDCGNPDCPADTDLYCADKPPGTICGAVPLSWDCPCRFSDGTLSTSTCY